MHRARRPLLLAVGGTIPHVFEYLLTINGVTRARPGRFGIDWDRHTGGFQLWIGAFHLEMDFLVNAARASRMKAWAAHRANAALELEVA